MPLYHYRCNQCGIEFEEYNKIEERYDLLCPECGGDVDILITKATVHIFKPFWHEDFDDKPVYVKSKKHYKELCEKYGVYAPHVFGVGRNLKEV